MKIIVLCAALLTLSVPLGGCGVRSGDGLNGSGLAGPVGQVMRSP